MGRVKEWGLGILDSLTELFMNGRTREQAIQEVTDLQMLSMHFEDRAEIEKQVRGVADHPDIFGSRRHHWHEIRRNQHQQKRWGIKRKPGSGNQDS